MDNLLRFLIDNHPAELLAGTAGIGLTGLLSVLGRRLVRARPAGRRWAGAIGWGRRLCIIFCLSSLGDSLLLWLAPQLGASFPPWPGSTLTLYLLLRLLLLFGALCAQLLAAWREGRAAGQGAIPRRDRSGGRRALTLFALVNLAMSGLIIDAHLVEPLRVETTEMTLAFEGLAPGERPLRIVHLSDTHLERYGPREEEVLRQVQALAPDIIVLTGDHLNTSYMVDPAAAADWRRFVSQLQAPYGIYAVRGTVEPNPEMMAALVEGTGVVWLEQESVQIDVRGEMVTLVGVACSHDLMRDTARLEEALVGVSGTGASRRAPTGGPTVLLYHSPDLILEAAERGVDLVLSGHTHGGQVRLPVLGAVVTFSSFGRRYAAGLFKERETRMVVSRGIGLEGGAAPRVRFLCRPEIVSIDLVGAVDLGL